MSSEGRLAGNIHINWLIMFVEDEKPLFQNYLKHNLLIDLTTGCGQSSHVLYFCNKVAGETHKDKKNIYM